MNKTVTQITDKSHRIRDTIETLSGRAEISNIVANKKHPEGANSKGVWYDKVENLRI